MESGILERTLRWFLGQGRRVLRVMRSTAVGGRAGPWTGKLGTLPDSLAGKASKGSQRCDKNRKAQMNWDARGPMCCAECGVRPSHPLLTAPLLLSPLPASLCFLMSSFLIPSFLPSEHLSLFYHAPSSCLICSLLSPVAPFTPFSLSPSACPSLSHG